MTTPITSPLITTTPTTAATPTTSTGTDTNPGSVLGKDDFLKLLVAQLKNQDPMDPMDGTQFAAQLAQFSTVEQLMDMNTKMDAQSSAAAQSQIAQQAAFATSLIGRDVILNGANVTAVDGTAPQINVDLGGAAQKLHVDVLGADGTTVIGSQDYTDVPAGTQTLTLDAAKIPAGTYTYKVTATDASGIAVTASGNTIGRVDSTVFQGGQVMLRVNGTVVPLTDITEVIPAPTTTGSSSSTTTH